MCIQYRAVFVGRVQEGLAFARYGCFMPGSLGTLRVLVGFQRDMETIWMSKEAQEEMEANLRLISRKTAKANFLLRNMRSRWDLFRQKHRDLAALVNDRYTNQACPVFFSISK